MDTIGEFLTRIRNAGMAGHEKVDVPSSNMRTGLAKILMDRGYIRNFKVVRDSRQGMMRVYLKYNDQGRHAIEMIQRVSRPGRRYYVPTSRIPSVRSGYGFAILSTSKGLMSSEDALKANVGGEFICKIW